LRENVLLLTFFFVFFWAHCYGVGTLFKPRMKPDEKTQIQARGGHFIREGRKNRKRDAKIGFPSPPTEMDAGLGFLRHAKTLVANGANWGRRL